MTNENQEPQTSGGKVPSDCLPRLVRQFERVEFENGLEVSLQEDGSLRIIATARGLRGIVIYPSSDNSCRIRAIGKIYVPNAKDRHEAKQPQPTNENQ